MTTRMTIRALRQRGYSKRKIARELGLHRNTVSHYLEELEAVDEEVGGLSHAKCTISTPGSGADSVPADAAKTDEETDDRPDGAPFDEKTASKCTIPTPGPVTGAKDGSGPGRQSHCEAYRAVIEAKLEAQLHAKRIWQDLVDEHGFEHSYQSAKRFVAKLGAKDPERVWRMECEPGEELQVDYGTLYLQIAGKRKKIQVLRCVGWWVVFIGRSSPERRTPRPESGISYRKIGFLVKKQSPLNLRQEFSLLIWCEV